MADSELLLIFSCGILVIISNLRMYESVTGKNTTMMDPTHSTRRNFISKSQLIDFYEMLYPKTYIRHTFTRYLCN